MNKIILAKNRKVEFPRRIKLTEPDTLNNYTYDLEFDPGLVTEAGTNLDANLVNLLQKNSLIDLKCNVVAETAVNSNLEIEIEGINEFVIFQGLKLILLLERNCEFNKPVQLKLTDHEDLVGEYAVKSYNNGTLEAVNSLKAGIYQLIYVNNNFILLSGNSSSNNSSSEIIFDEDISISYVDRKYVYETNINIPEKYKYINIIISQGTFKMGGYFSRELIENTSDQFYNLLPNNYDDNAVQINIKNGFLNLLSYYGINLITHIKLEGIK